MLKIKNKYHDSDINLLKNLIKDKQFFVFDFDGTLVNSNNIKNDAFKHLYRNYPSNVINDISNYHISNQGLSRFTKIQFIQEKIIRKKLSKSEYHSLLAEFSDFVIDKVVKCKEISGAMYLIKQLKRMNKNTIINSATPTNELQEILKKKNWIDHFDYIYGSPNTKIENLKVLLFDKDPSNFLILGDSHEDLKVANNYKIDFISVNNHNLNMPKQFINKFIKIKDFNHIL